MSELLRKAKLLSPKIRVIIHLANNYFQAIDYFHLKNPTPYGQLPSYENYQAYHSDVNIIAATKIITEYLETLSYDEVVMIQAIMYIGRDEKDPEEYALSRSDFEELGERFDEPEDGVYHSHQKKIFDYLKHIKSDVSNTKEISIDGMLEKSPLSEYLTRGLKILDL